MQNQLTFIRETNWQEVFDDWREREKGIWDEHYRERGHASWDEWRSKFVAPVRPQERTLFDQCRTQQESGTFLDDLRTDKM